MASRKYSKEYMESLKHKSEPLPITLAEKIDTYKRVLVCYEFLEQTLTEHFLRDQPVNYETSRRKKEHTPSTSQRKPKKELPKLIDRISERAVGQLDAVKKVKIRLEKIRRELGFEEDVGPYLWKLTYCIVETERVTNNLLSLLKNRGYYEKEL